MAATQYDITVEQGATYRLLILWRDSNGVPIDLTDYTASMMIRGDFADGAPLVSLTDASGITLGGDQGSIDIEVDAADTADLQWDGYARWDLKLTSGETTPVVTRLLEGRARLAPAATK